MGSSRTFNVRPSAGEPSEDWLTPPGIIGELALQLDGDFDLDPACPPSMPWPTAKRMICRPEDGLSADWGGGNVRVWLNPPYGREAASWIARLAAHGNGIALVFARTDTRWWHEHIFGRASALLFLRGRVQFCRPDGREEQAAPAPSVLISYGGECAAALRRVAKKLDGAFVELEKKS